MIIAMSRFRVKNDREQDVRQAFVNRPRLVDDQAGFLGLEVFQDATDAAIFYLVTRWSDLATFRAWHSSQAHRRSHDLMPKGLKLDSSFTELRYLQRVEGEPEQEALEHFPADWGALTSAHLASSMSTHGLVAALDGSILGATAAMRRLLGSEAGPLRGRSLWQFLTPQSVNDLRGRITAGIRQPEVSFTLTFTGAASGARTLICNLDVQPDAFAMLCEPISAAMDSSQNLRNPVKNGAAK